MLRLGILHVGFVLVLVSSPLTAATLTVDLQGGADHTDIQSAIDAAADGDTVLVKPGEYVITEPIDFNRLHNPSDPMSPPKKDLVVRSEAGPAVTIIRMFEGAAAGNPVVIFKNSEGNNSVLQGFTASGGKGGTATDATDPRTAGGIVFENTKPTLSTCTISGNSPSGVSCFLAAPTLTDCTISGNSGRAVHCRRSSPMLTDCTISGNSAYHGIAGIFCEDLSWPNLTDCTISGNSGAGVVVWRDANVWLTDCTVSGNSGCGVEGTNAKLTGCTISGNSGGGVNCGRKTTLTSCTVSENSGDGVICGFDMTLTNCTISGNSGTGVDASEGSSSTLTGCTISGNSGGGVACRGHATLTNCTISGNGGDSVGGLDFHAGSAALVNCIVWDNAGGSLVVADDWSQSVSFSCLETDTVWPGEGNINADPLFCGWKGPAEVFVDPAGDEPGDGSEGRPFRELGRALEYRFSLRGSSPCVGSGKDGVNMGADAGVCDDPGSTERVIHVAAGSYGLETMTLAHGESILGAGEDRTVLEGTVSGLRTGAMLSGVTVTGGLHGGVVISNGEHPTIEDCRISGNSTDALGGGVYCAENSSPTLTNCTISGNSTGTQGGGLYCAENSSPTLTNCTISGNAAPAFGPEAQYGGGVHCQSSSPTLTSCTISGNSGGGFYSNEGSSPTLTSCTISGNLRGGLVCKASSSPILGSCTISGNLGVAVSCRGGSSPTLTNCTISRNSAGPEEHTVSCWSSSPTLTNCTISGNAGGGVYCSDGSSPALTNCIVWRGTGPCIVATDDSHPSISFSCLETDTVWPGEGNINADPLLCGWKGPAEVFVDAAGAEPGDGSEGKPFRELGKALEYRLSLQGSSPCVGSGKDGANMGADSGVCDGRGPASRVIHLAAGSYSLEGMSLAHGESILGAGEDRTVLEGPILGLRTGARLSRMTTRGTTVAGIDMMYTVSGTIIIDEDASPEIEDLTSEGCVFCYAASPSLTNCTLSGNDDNPGVWFHKGASPAVTNCTISGGPTLFAGGVYCTDHSSPTLTNCTVSGCPEYSLGAVSCYESSPSLTNCTISENAAIGVYAEYSEPVLTDCTISGNAGGGLLCDQGGHPRLTNCAIWGNSARDGGGGVASGEKIGMTLTNCTISGNSATDNGGISCYTNRVTLTNCIVWGNSPESACVTLSHCLTDEDPLFVENGVFDFGRWKTVTIGGEEHALPDFIIVPPDFHLRAGSPAIDAGSAEGAPAIDIEGRARPCGENVDIGAHESGDCIAVKFLRGDVDGLSRINISDPIRLLDFLFHGAERPSCLDAADIDDSGKLDISDAIYSLGFQFLGGKAPRSPFPGCGVDPFIDDLTCVSFEACP